MMRLGRVDEVDGNYVATRFLAGVLPVGSVYVASKGPRPTGSTEAIAIRTSWKSIGAAYGRLWAPVAAVAVLYFGAIRGALRGEIHTTSVLVTIVLLAASALAHRFGRLSDGEKERVRLLGTVTGLRIDPRLLQPATHEAKRAALHGLMEKAGIPTSAQSILAVVDDIPVPALPLVYGYARYAGDDPRWRECAEALYRRHETSII